MATDTFGFTVKRGDTLYVPVVVTDISDNDVFVCEYTQEDESTVTITAQSGENGRTSIEGKAT